MTSHRRVNLLRYLAMGAVFLALFLWATYLPKLLLEVIWRGLNGSSGYSWASPMSSSNSNARRDDQNAPSPTVLEETVATYRQLLTTYSQEQEPLRWAMTQSNL